MIAQFPGAEAAYIPLVPFVAFGVYLVSFLSIHITRSYWTDEEPTLRFKRAVKVISILPVLLVFYLLDAFLLS